MKILVTSSTGMSGHAVVKALNDTGELKYTTDEEFMERQIRIICRRTR